MATPTFIVPDIFGIMDRQSTPYILTTRLDYLDTHNYRISLNIHRHNEHIYRSAFDFAIKNGKIKELFENPYCDADTKYNILDDIKYFYQQILCAFTIEHQQNHNNNNIKFIKMIEGDWWCNGRLGPLLLAGHYSDNDILTITIEERSSTWNITCDKFARTQFIKELKGLYIAIQQCIDK